MAIAIACVSACFARLRRVHGAAKFDLGALSTALGREANAARLSEMRDILLAEGPGWEADLLQDVLAARDSVERTALVNERLGDVAANLGWGARIPAVAARISVMGPLFFVFFSLALRGRIGLLTDIVPIVGWGGAGVLGALATGREAERVASVIRRNVDVWVGRVLEAATQAGPKARAE